MRYATLMRDAQPVMAATFEYDLSSDTLKDGKKTYSIQEMQPGTENRIPLIRLPNKAFVLRALITVEFDEPRKYSDEGKKIKELGVECAKNGETTFTSHRFVDFYDIWDSPRVAGYNICAEANEVFLIAKSAVAPLTTGKLTIVIQYIVRGRATQLN